MLEILCSRQPSPLTYDLHPFAGNFRDGTILARSGKPIAHVVCLNLPEPVSSIKMCRRTIDGLVAEADADVSLSAVAVYIGPWDSGEFGVMSGHLAQAGPRDVVVRDGFPFGAYDIPLTWLRRDKIPLADFIGDH